MYFETELQLYCVNYHDIIFSKSHAFEDWLICYMPQIWSKFRFPYDKRFGS